ncbi:Uncharacterised protein [Pseudomonas putida]|nr:Uncharacterised protein [Pseudomonas putida]CAB5548075.1 Uncharacterised protein [Pseudomonas putida]CAB5599027.1 Uncharacterised protein [Pseudomonas putida]CAB5604567.1 Uncharacterised protein [Pseudomonas putida]CAB5681977.1 Uncharacterised protein [Pseudomonas putida]
MRYSLFDGQRDIIILLARVLLMILFILSGWSKLTGFEGMILPSSRGHGFKHTSWPRRPLG